MVKDGNGRHFFSLLNTVLPLRQVHRGESQDNCHSMYCISIQNISNICLLLESQLSNLTSQYLEFLKPRFVGSWAYFHLSLNKLQVFCAVRYGKFLRTFLAHCFVPQIAACCSLCQPLFIIFTPGQRFMIMEVGSPKLMVEHSRTLLLCCKNLITTFQH